MNSVLEKNAYARGLALLKARAPWRAQVLREVRDYKPHFNLATFNERMGIIERALDIIGEPSPKPFAAFDAMLLIALSTESRAGAEDVARKLFGKHTHLLAPLFGGTFK